MKELALIVLLLYGSTGCAATAHVRLNQVGYPTDGAKRAVLMAGKSKSGASFQLIDSNSTVVYSAPVGARIASWNKKYRYLYTLDFSSITTPGSYTIVVPGPLPASSAAFRIDSNSNLYGNLLSNALAFYKAQRDGRDVDGAVLNRQPSHLADENAFVYETPVYKDDVLQGNLSRVGGPMDVSGGWFDAGDYLKFVQTTTFTTGVLLMAVRNDPVLLGVGQTNFALEARIGVDWLLKMWDDNSQTLFYQVGIGEGNGKTILSDHDIWRLPEDDDAMNAQPGDPFYYVEYRPVFRAGPAGSQISPNLAGRLAAVFALASQVYRQTDAAYADRCLRSAEHVLDLAKTTGVGELLTAAPYDFYPEVEWREDLEWGSAELYFATSSGSLPPGLPHTDPQYYLQLGAQWAHEYLVSPNRGADSLNLYDVSALAHYDLYNAFTSAGNPTGLAVQKSEVLADLKHQLNQALAVSQSDPFALGMGYRDGDVAPHALGLAVTAYFYDQLANDSSYAAFAQRQIDFVLGSNAWGVSFVVGAGSNFPHCVHHQIGNLAGALDGTSPLLLGAVGDGPSSKSAFKGLGLPDGARACPLDGADPYKNFTGKKVRFMDNVIAWPSVEPTLDYTVFTVFLYSWLIHP